jgi:alkanesulfonate monooxygenase SsuD/methylene tetrahydromethanopterin reductase-like flavin-dependent oxidoreductase (luciferase family)
VQAPLPVWFAGPMHNRNLERVVVLGDGWIPVMGASLDEVRAGAARLRAAFEAAGRRPESLRVQAPATLAPVPALVAAGATDVIVHLAAVCRDPAEAPATLRALADRFAVEAG